MKVCTDACVFGAWLCTKARALFPDRFTALDIGAGTGLLSLMLAQETKAAVDAWELDEAASKQAAGNVAASLWSLRIRAVQADARSFVAGKLYDLIFSNPPFYEDSLPSPRGTTNLARHGEGLTMRQLLEVTDKHLSAAGYMGVLLPYYRTQAFLLLAASFGLYPVARLSLQHSPLHPFSRSCLLLSRTAVAEPAEEPLSIRSGGGYSQAFTTLLHNFYLHL